VKITSKVGLNKKLDGPYNEISIPSAARQFATTGGNVLTSEDKSLPDEALLLVPCRWSNTGWKYVQTDPKAQKFFTNPNRSNSFGWTDHKKDYGWAIEAQKRKA